MGKRIRRLLLVVGLCGLVVFVIDGCPTIAWVGGTDLTVEFVVTDAETGEPISGADIAIKSYGGLNDDGTRLSKSESKEEEFKLTTDERGIATYVCRNSMCFGTQSRLRFTNTYRVHLPWWFVTTHATGYPATSPFWLDKPEHIRAVKRVGPQQAKLVVPIAMRKDR